jgi:hypothetical protein
MDLLFYCFNFNNNENMGNLPKQHFLTIEVVRKSGSQLIVHSLTHPPKAGRNAKHYKVQRGATVLIKSML